MRLIERERIRTCPDGVEQLRFAAVPHTHHADQIPQERVDNVVDSSKSYGSEFEQIFANKFPLFMRIASEYI